MSGFMQASHVFLDNPATTVEEALVFLSEKAVELGIADDAASVLDAYHKREEEGSTGMVDGYAIPHAKSEVITKPGVLVLKMAQGLEWPSFDGEPLSIALALLVPGGEAGTTHVRLLSKTAVMLMDEEFRAFLRGSNNPVAIAAEINARLEA